MYCNISDFIQRIYNFEETNGLVVKAGDSRLRGRGFESSP